MLDQDTARALLAIADRAHAPSRSSATATSCPPSAAAASSTSPPAGRHPRRTTTLETVHRFTDPDYADLSLLMRTGERSW